MDTGTIIWIVVAVVVVIALIALFAALGRRRKATKNRQHAETLRQDAHAQQTAVQQEELRAREAEAEAERKRVEAERAEAAAAEARQAHLQEHARVEDQVREADRVDPDVDHRADDYHPGTTTTGTTGATTATGTTGNTGTDPRVAEDPAHQAPVEGTPPPAHGSADPHTDEPRTGGTHRA